MISNSRASFVAAILVCLIVIIMASLFVPLASATRLRQGTPLPTDLTRTPAARESSISTPPAATPTPEVTRTAIPAGQVYIVQSGDTLWSIAIKFYGTGSRYTIIQRANNLPENSIIAIGTVLTIPPFPDVTLIPSMTATVIVITPSPSPTPELPISVTLPSSTITPIVSQPALTDSKIIGDSWTPLVPYILLLINVLSGLCFLGSLVCVYLALESYRHSRPYVRRRRIGNRVRDGL